ncbi:hypothetical protein PV416_19185 [Streptomyces ipomoeae]|uniref:hypothetical protein n=2 Tax=Streptomyces ipomoeae TaxID=103232 RepID=UPI0029BB6662|nr:hypothetical protein [Streptomyces ipomoeae]MDX2823180.1 hypothetical protein [Streptomyces ipomoeae]MDX2876501.1 hypothetical protein [Streptomyces ipomoeae]
MKTRVMTSLALPAALATAGLLNTAEAAYAAVAQDAQTGTAAYGYQVQPIDDVTLINAGTTHPCTPIGNVTITDYGHCCTPVGNVTITDYSHCCTPVGNITITDYSHCREHDEHGPDYYGRDHYEHYDRYGHGYYDDLRREQQRS